MQRGLSQPGVVRGSFFQEVAFEQRPECEIKQAAEVVERSRREQLREANNLDKGGWGWQEPVGASEGPSEGHQKGVWSETQSERGSR